MNMKIWITILLLLAAILFAVFTPRSVAELSPAISLAGSPLPTATAPVDCSSVCGTLKIVRNPDNVVRLHPDFDEWVDFCIAEYGPMWCPYQTYLPLIAK